MAYPTYDLVVIGQVGLAGLAAVDAFGVEVDVVGEAHLCQAGVAVWCGMGSRPTASSVSGPGSEAEVDGWVAASLALPVCFGACASRSPLWTLGKVGRSAGC
jgi:hypothetical protein